MPNWQPHNFWISSKQKMSFMDELADFWNENELSTEEESTAAGRLVRK